MEIFTGRDFNRSKETLLTEDNEMILDYSGKLSRIVVETRGLGEKISDSEIAAKLLQSVSEKFDAITSSREPFQDIDTMTLDEVLRSLKIH